LWIRSRIFLIVIWILFAIVFLCLGIKHYNLSKLSYPQFTIEMPKSPGRPSFYNEEAAVNQKRFEDFLKKFNAYIEDYNKQSSSANDRSFWGYLISSMVSFFSALIEFVAILRNKQRKPTSLVSSRTHSWKGRKGVRS
jgi:hypothetical protein